MDLETPISGPELEKLVRKRISVLHVATAPGADGLNGRGCRLSAFDCRAEVEDGQVAERLSSRRYPSWRNTRTAATFADEFLSRCMYMYLSTLEVDKKRQERRALWRL